MKSKVNEIETERQALLGAISRGWHYPKIMDVELAFSIADEVLKLYSTQKTPKIVWYHTPYTEQNA